MLNRRKAKPFKLCLHWKPDGKRCGAPALRRRSYCRHHEELLQRQRRMAVARRAASLKERLKGAQQEDERQRSLIVSRVLNWPWFRKALRNGIAENTLPEFFR